MHTANVSWASLLVCMGRAQSRLKVALAVLMVPLNKNCRSSELGAAEKGIDLALHAMFDKCNLMAGK